MKNKNSPVYKIGTQLKNVEKKYLQRIKKPSQEHFFEIEDLIIGKMDGEWVAYDNVCDHNGGPLRLNDDKKTATCPLHKWTLNLSLGFYENKCPKKRLALIESNDYLDISRVKNEFPVIQTDALIIEGIDLYFNAHASVTAMVDDVSITADPWFDGSCFATGWWHVNPPSMEAVERLIASDFIYISHNHPDHLHLQTLLKYVSKDTAIIVPNFESKSVERILIKNGFHNLVIADFLQEIEITTKKGVFKVIVIKSGDDRDDSSLLVLTNQNSIFLGVDTNMPNKWVLPKVDVLYTPFAGGASGFPSRVENFSMEEKGEIIEKNKNFMLTNHVNSLIKATSPKIVIPYAGYFSESQKDIDVKKINIKNSPKDLIKYVEKNFSQIRCVDPIETPHISICGDEFKMHVSDEAPSYFVDEEYIKKNLEEFTGVNWEVNDDFLNLVGEEFIKSDFYDDLTVVIVPSDESIGEAIAKALVIDFSLANRSFNLLNLKTYNNEEIIGEIQNHNQNNIEILKIRGSSFYGSIVNGLPLEDLSIGFQVKMYRIPNIYNMKFWDYFTNIHFIKLKRRNNSGCHNL